MSRILPHHPADDCVPDSLEHMEALGWAPDQDYYEEPPDRPTGPATAAGQALYDAWITHTDDSWTLDDMESAILAIEAEQKARILAALPEALDDVAVFVESHGEWEAAFAGSPDEFSAALAAAIEQVLGKDRG